MYICHIQVGDEIEVRPGILTKDNEGQIHCRPIFSRIVSLFAEHNDLKFAVPGGLIGSCLLFILFILDPCHLLTVSFNVGVGTKIDPTLCRADRLVGQVLGAVGKLPKIYTELEINYFLLRRLLGVKTDDKKVTKVRHAASL